MKQLCRALLLLSVTFIYSQNPEVEIMNTSINSVYAELGVTFLNNNTLIFASSKKVTTDKNFSKKRTRTNKHLNLTLYQGVITDKGDIIQTKKFSNEKNNKVHESEISFTPDGKTVYFTWNNFYNTQKRKDSAKWKTLQVMRGSINEKFEISNITHLPFNSEEYSVRCPEVSKDGKQLFFASDMPGNIGGHDIYVVDILNDNSFSQPKNLGKNVNTKLHEFYPFIDENNTLYFSSYGHKGLGDLDIFKSEYKNNNYQLAENLQAPINSKYDDFGFVIKNYNKTGFFTSNRDGSIGGVDIYAFKTKEKECKPILYVTVLNKETNEIILKPSVLIYENKQLLENNSYQNSTDINFNLRCLQPYKITAKKEGFSVAEIEFETNDLSDTVHKKIYLTPLICNQTISGFVFNNKDKQQIESAKVSLFVNKELKETKVTKLNEKFSFTIECGNSYKIITEKDGFVSDEKEFNIDNTRDKLVTADVQLTPLICNQTISGFVFNDKDKQQIQLAKVSLFVNNQLKETQVTQLNTKFSFTIECGNSYKIITEKEGFVTDEKDFNIDNTRDKLVTADIQLTPLICNQTISGFVFNEKDKQQIELVKVSLFVNNQLKETQVTQLNTKFSFTIECGNSYKIITEKEGFVTDEKDFNIDNTRDKTVAADIQLTPLICNQTISGFVFNDKDRQQIELAKVSLFVNNKLKETQVTQQNTKFSFTIECGNSYKIITEKDGFVSDEKEFNIDNTRDKLVTADIQLTPLICNQIISGFVFNEKDKQQIELAKVSLFMNNQLKETQVTQLNTKFSFTIECGNSYKIITEKDGFVSDEKDFNIDNTRDKTVAADIQLTPLICNQTISGFVFNEKDKQQIESAKISLFVNNKLKETQVTQSNTKFSFTIECGNSYKIITEKEGFVTDEKDFNIDNTRDKIVASDIQLTPLICNQTISGFVFNEKDKQQIESAKISLFVNNKLKETQVTQSNTKFSFTIECGNSYKIVTEKEGFVTSENKFNIDNTRDKTVAADIQLTPLICNQTISGFVFNEKDKQQIESAKISLFVNNKLKETQVTQSNTKFSFTIECGNSYKIVTEKDGFVTSEKKFNIDNTRDKLITADVQLTPVICNSLISGTILDIDTKKQLAIATVKIYQNNLLIENLSLDTNANFNFKGECNSEYKIIASLKNHKNAAVTIATSTKNNEAIHKVLLLESIIEFITTTNQKMIKTKAITFDLDSDEISTNTAIELNKVVGVLLKYPTMQIDIQSHTDSRAPDNYNLTLSEDRVLSIINYIESQGIDRNRVTGEGYGETQLLNKCANGVKCSNAEHEENRRTEFIILSE